MATPATIWATNAGAGAADGTSLADAYALAAAVTAFNALGALSQKLTVRICGDCTIAAALEITKDATSPYRVIWQGRNAGDTADEEVDIDAGDGAYDVWTLTTADKHEFHHIHATNTDEAAGHDGWAPSANADNLVWYKCRASHCHRGWNLDAGSTHDSLIECRSHDNADAGVYGNTYASYFGCAAHANGTDGFYKGTAVRCLSYSNTAGDGFYLDRPAAGCIGWANGSDGFAAQSGYPFPCVDCIAVNNGAYGFYSGSANNRLILLRCADYNNTSGRNDSGTGTWDDIDEPAITADPFTDAANGDFSLNVAAGGGLLLRGLSFAFPAALTTSYHDIGAAQHRSGLLVHPGTSGGARG